MINNIAERHDVKLGLHNTWRSIVKFCEKSSGSDKLLFAKTIHVPLPVEFFGSHELDGITELKSMHGTSLDVYSVIGNALLNVNPDNIVEKYCESFMANGNQASTTFASSERMKKVSDDIRNCGTVMYRELDSGLVFDSGEKPFHLLLGVSTDATHLNHNGSKKEQPLLISFLNAVNESYEMIMTGLVPINFPYSDDTMISLLRNQGFVLSTHINNIMMYTKRQAMLSFICSSFQDLVEEGNNCFKVCIFINFTFLEYDYNQHESSSGSNWDEWC